MTDNKGLCIPLMFDDKGQRLGDDYYPSGCFALLPEVH